MNRYLVIITDDMNNGEWLTDEMRYHYQMGYDRIYCFNTATDIMIADDVSDIAECRCLRYSRVRLLPRLLAATFSHEYREEKRSVADTVEKKKSALWMYAFALLYRSIIRRELSRNGVSRNDSIVFYSYWMSVQSLTAVLLKNLYRNSVCVTRCHNVDVYPGRTRLGYIEYQNYLAEQNDHIFPISVDGADAIQKLLKIDGCDKGCIDRKVVVSRLGCKPINRDIRVRDEEVFHIITCSTVTPVKRVELVIDILNEIKDVRIEWNHYGDGILREELIDKTKGLNSNITFVFHGRVPHEEILTRFASGEDDLLLNVSSFEGVPVSIMEAYSSGLPVVATDVGGVREILTGLQRKFLIACDFDSEYVSGLIRSIIEMDETYYTDLSDDCRRIWREMYNSDKNYTEFAQRIYDLI